MTPHPTLFSMWATALRQDAATLKLRIEGARDARRDSVTLGLHFSAEVCRLMERAADALDPPPPALKTCDFCQDFRVKDVEPGPLDVVGVTGTNLVGVEARCARERNRMIAERWASGDQRPSWCPRHE